jgi:WD40 repeat protein
MKDFYVRRYGVSDKVLVVAGEDEAATVYDLQTGKALGDLPGRHRFRSLALSADGRWLLTVGHDEKVCVWDVGKRRLECELYDHSADPVKGLAISADGAWCATLTTRRVWVFDRAKRAEAARALTMFSWRGGDGLTFTPDGKTIVAYGQGARHGLFVWDWQKSGQPRGGYPEGWPRKAHLEPERKLDPGWAGEVTVGPDGVFLARRGHDLHLWDLKPPVSAEPPARVPPKK